MRPFRVALAAITFLELLTAVAWGDERGTVPASARLSLEFDKRDYFLGENVLVNLILKNVGTRSFHIDLGGDYRGSPRHLRFSVKATDAKGKEVPDPDPNPICMGGLSYSKEIKPGEKHTERLALMRYRRFERRGTYRLSVSHDFGWTEKSPEPRPVAHATITFVMPTPKQAEKVVAEAYALPKDEADFTTLIFPVYLPILLPRARKGDEQALKAIGAMPFPKATIELIRLVEHENADFARKALQQLTLRLPDPVLKEKLAPRSAFDFDWHHRRRWLVKESWRDNFAPQVRRVGRRLLVETDANSLACGGYILQCLGEQEDVGVVARALGQAALAAKNLPVEKNHYPRPRGGCQELMRAAQAMIQRGVKVNADPKTDGELLMFIGAIRWGEMFRPAGWENILITALRHELPYVREMALEAVPLPLSKRARTLLPQLLGDKNVDVQIAACHLAGQSKLPELREPVLAVLRTARDQWLFNAASNAAYSLDARLERLRTLAARLEEKEVAKECLSYLTGILSGTSGHSCSLAWDPVIARDCKQEWQGFLTRNAKALAAGKTFSLADASVPLKKLFPGYTFYPK